MSKKDQFLKLRRSAVPGKIPDTSSIDFGEIALNTYDGLAFMKKSGSNGEEVIPIGAAPATASYALTASYFVTSSVTSASYSVTASYVIGQSATASYALTASYLIGQSSTSSYALTASYVDNAQTASYFITSSVTSASYAVTASYLIGQSATSSYALTASYVENSRTASYFVTSSVTSASYSATASYVVNALTASYFITSSVTSASYAITASYAKTAPDYLPISGGTITGDLIINNNLVVYGTASFIYVTASQLDVSASFISVNVFEPSQRFGGLKVYDSGSSTATASLAWDSLYNHWVYQNASGSTYSGGMFIAGPKNSGSLGQEVGLTEGRIPVAQGEDHISDSDIINITGSYVGVTVNTQISGSLIVTNGITGSLFGTATNADTASYVETALTASYFVTSSVTSASFAFTASYVVNALTASYFVTSSVTSASYAATASYVNNAQTASYFLTSSVTSASYSSYSVSSSNSLYALSASYAANVGFNYTASYTNQSTWVVNHNFNYRFVIVQAFDSNYNEIIPQNIELTDSNTTTVYFPTLESGYVIVSVGGAAYFSTVSASYSVSSSLATLAATASYFSGSISNATNATYASTASYLNPIVDSYVVLTNVSQSLNFVDDAAAALGGVPLGGLYRNGNFILIRIS